MSEHASNPHQPPLPNLATLLELPAQFEYDAKQLEAIAACCDTSRRIVPVTGEAGTGKTRIIAEVYKRLTAAGYSVVCSAPTGKAAKRIQESTSIPAVTNHRLLGYGQPLELEEEDADGKKKVVKLSTGPTYKRSRPLPYDVILGDEYAMVNREIHDNLIAALPTGGRICMFGDTNQLKPIEEDRDKQDAPSAFQTAIAKFDGITLDVNHRQQEGSGIAANARAILQGKIPKRFPDFDIFYSDDPVQRLMAFIDKCKEEGFDYSSANCQIITCMNKSWIGTKKLNIAVQSYFWHRDRHSIDLPRHTWRDQKSEEPIIRVQEGSKVVYTANTYDLGEGHSAFNGEVGIVTHINDEDGSVSIDFGDRIATIPPLIVYVRPQDGRVIEQDPRKNIDLAYVLTTHKMQGSESPRVCYIINKSTSYGQSRRNFYTGVSRAREHCTVITDQGSLVKSTKWEG